MLLMHLNWNVNTIASHNYLLLQKLLMHLNWNVNTISDSNAKR